MGSLLPDLTLKNIQQIVTIIINRQLYSLIFMQILCYMIVLCLSLNMKILLLDLSHIQNKLENSSVLLQKPTKTLQSVEAGYSLIDLSF